MIFDVIGKNATELNGAALLYDDYMKLREAKIGDVVRLSDGNLYKVVYQPRELDFCYDTSYDEDCNDEDM